MVGALLGSPWVPEAAFGVSVLYGFRPFQAAIMSTALQPSHLLLVHRSTCSPVGPVNGRLAGHQSPAIGVILVAATEIRAPDVLRCIFFFLKIGGSAILNFHHPKIS